MKNLVALIYILTLLLCGLLFLDTPIYSQEINFQKAYSDYLFTNDSYQSALADYTTKKDTYLKNSTLLLKEEARISLFAFLTARTNLMKSYINVLKVRSSESKGLTDEQKGEVYTKLSTEYEWIENYSAEYKADDSIEALIDKSKTESQRIIAENRSVINFTLINISLGDTIKQDRIHRAIYDQLKSEAESLVNLGRADSSLFNRWFVDIEAEFNNLQNSENIVAANLAELMSSETYKQKRAFDSATKSLYPAKESLLKINQFLYELENIVEEKR